MINKYLVRIQYYPLSQNPPQEVPFEIKEKSERDIEWAIEQYRRNRPSFKVIEIVKQN